MPANDDEFDDDRPSHRRRRDEDDFDPRPKKKGIGLVAIVVIVVGVVVLCGGCVVAGLFFSTSKVRDAANRMKSNNNMKQIGLGIANYESAMDEIPANSYGPDGKPLLSWRVHILPYVEQDNLYKQFKVDEPWDSTNNIRLLNQMPHVYLNPKESPGSTSKTYYRGFSSPGAVFEKRPGRGRAGAMADREPKERFTVGQFKDLPNQTIVMVEAGEPVEWTKPDDLDASPGKPFPPLGGMQWSSKRVNVLLADFTVRAIKPDLPETTLRALVTHSGGETIPPGWDE
jgi:hypothetical protein